jgi:hypothetical protein
MGMDKGRFKGDFSALPLLRCEGNIIYFPGAWRDEPAPRTEPVKSSWDLSWKIVQELGLLDIKYIRHRAVVTALCRANVKSVEKLARYPLEKLNIYRNVGPRTIGAIREALKNKGYMSEIEDKHERERNS